MGETCKRRHILRQFSGIALVVIVRHGAESQVIGTPEADELRGHIMSKLDTVNGQRLVISLGEVEGLPVAYRRPIEGPARLTPAADAAWLRPLGEANVAGIEAAKAAAAEIQAARAAVRQAQAPKAAARRRGIEAAPPMTEAGRRRTQAVLDLILARLTEGTADPAVALARVEAIAPALPVALYDSAVDAISAAAEVMGKDLRLRPSWLARVRGNSDGLDAQTRRSRRAQERTHQRTRSLGAQFESNDASRPRVNHNWRTSHTAQPVTELRPVWAVGSGAGAWAPCRDTECGRPHTVQAVEVTVAPIEAPKPQPCECGGIEADCEQCHGYGTVTEYGGWVTEFVERRGCVRPPVVEDAAQLFAVRHANPARVPAGIVTEYAGLRGKQGSSKVVWLQPFGDRREGNRANAWPTAAAIGPDSPWRVPSIPAESPLRVEAAAWRARAHDARLREEELVRAYRTRAGVRSTAQPEVPWVEAAIPVEDLTNVAVAQGAVVCHACRRTHAGICGAAVEASMKAAREALGELGAAVEAVEAAALALDGVPLT